MTKSTAKSFSVHIDDDETAFIQLIEKHMVLYMGEARAKNLCGDCSLAMLATFCIAQITLRESKTLGDLDYRAKTIGELLGTDAAVVAHKLAIDGEARDIEAAAKPH